VVDFQGINHGPREDDGGYTTTARKEAASVYTFRGIFVVTLGHPGEPGGEKDIDQVMGREAFLWDKGRMSIPWRSFDPGREAVAG